MVERLSFLLPPPKFIEVYCCAVEGALQYSKIHKGKELLNAKYV